MAPDDVSEPIIAGFLPQEDSRGLQAGVKAAIRQNDYVDIHTFLTMTRHQAISVMT